MATKARSTGDGMVDLLRDCVVLVRSADPRNPAFGTGFFVAPRQVVTCGHVVRECGDEIEIVWRKTAYRTSPKPRLVPATRGSDRYGLLPDLALLKLPTLIPGQPNVWLDDQGAPRGATVTVVGFNRRSRPLRGEAEAGEPALGEARFRLVGLDGQTWRIRGDSVTGGMSGSPVLSRATGRVVGVVKAKIDQGAVDGGWIVDVDELRDAFRGLGARNDRAHTRSSQWRMLATRRDDLAREAFGSEPGRLDPRQWADRSPAFWLDPRNKVVGFVPPPEFRELREWCVADDGTTRVRLVHAPGGVGKTRLALELAESLRADGWVAGLVDTDRAMVTFQAKLDLLLQARHAVFCAIDYAETNVSAIRPLLQALANVDTRRVRILLLSRTAGKWWENLFGGMRAEELIARTATRLGNIGNDGSEGVVLAGYQTFRRYILEDSDAQRRRLPRALAEWSAGHHRVLDLHAAALTQVLDERAQTLDGGEVAGPRHGDPLDALLRHEREYWRAAVESRPGRNVGEGRLSDRLLITPTLHPTADAHAARLAIGRVPDEGEELPGSAGDLAAILAGLYPGENGRYWSAMSPDRVAERLLSGILADADSGELAAEEIIRLVGAMDGHQAIHVVTILGRIARLTEEIPDRQKIADRAYTVMAGLGHHQPAVFGPLVTQILKDAGPIPRRRAEREALSAGEGPANYPETANVMGSVYQSWVGSALAADTATPAEFRRLGVTARGAWAAAVERLRAAGRDPDKDPLTVVGIGDMSGDVFGNGMLQSDQILLIAAFNERHIFVDPTPDPVAAFAERQRLFHNLPSSWDRYDKDLLDSSGGNVWSRSGDDPIELSPQAHRALGLSDDIGPSSPDELVEHILRAPVDLLWSAGTGTFVVSTDEAAHALDEPRVRVPARQLRCLVVAEPARKGLSPRARAEFAARRDTVGTDYVDGAAGVYCFDRVVNAQFVMYTAVDRSSRTELTAAPLRTVMRATAAMALDDAARQRLALRVESGASIQSLPSYQRVISDLEGRGVLDRALEGIPDDNRLSARRGRRGLTQPELAAVLAHVRIGTARSLLEAAEDDGDAFEDSWAGQILTDYFPPTLRKKFSRPIDEHPFRREIIAAQATDEIVNNAGLRFFLQMREETRRDHLEIARAYFATKAVFGVESLVKEVESIDRANIGPTGHLQPQLWLFFLEGSRWFLSRTGVAQKIDSAPREIGWLLKAAPQMITARARDAYRRRIDTLKRDDTPTCPGVARNLAERLAVLQFAHHLLNIAFNVPRERELAEYAEVYFRVLDVLPIWTILSYISALPHTDRWQARSSYILRTQLCDALCDIATDVTLIGTPGDSVEDRVHRWHERNEAIVAHLGGMVDDIEAETTDFPRVLAMVRAVQAVETTMAV